MNLRRILFFALLLITFSGCYSFKGISIDPDVKTFYVQNFESITGNAPPTLALDFTVLLDAPSGASTATIISTWIIDVTIRMRIVLSILRFLVSGFWLVVAGSRFLVSGFWFRIRDLQPRMLRGTPNQRLRTKNQKPETRN